MRRDDEKILLTDDERRLLVIILKGYEEALTPLQKKTTQIQNQIEMKDVLIKKMWGNYNTEQDGSLVEEMRELTDNFNYEKVVSGIRDRAMRGDSDLTVQIPLGGCSVWYKLDKDGFIIVRQEDDGTYERCLIKW